MKKLLSLSIAAALGGILFGQPAGAADNDGQALVKQGEYLAVAGDCAACHTAPGGKPFAGGLAINTPIGNIISTNITPSETAGIGRYSLTDFERAIRQGIRRDGAHLYPAMPYTSYAVITDSDMKALYAYFMQGVAPVDVRPQTTALPFPFNLRFSMAVWDSLYARAAPFVADAGHSAEWNRGAYLVQGLAHCSTCHTPRNFLMAEQSGQALAGASLGTWFAPNITPDKQAGIGQWSAGDIASYLQTGRSPTGSQAGGPMLEAIDKSFSKLSAADIHAIVTYLQGVKPQSANAPPGRLATTQPLISDVGLMNGSASQGARLYAEHCSTCHQVSGQGSHGLPALYNNAAFRRPVADNAVMAILDGLTPASGQAMPAFRTVMNDQQVATLVNYLFKNDGDAGVRTTPERVNTLRNGGAPSPLLAIAKGGMIALLVVVIVLVIGGGILKSRRRQR